MRFSINEPLCGSVPVVITVEKYIDLLRTLTYREPVSALRNLYKFGNGFSVDDEGSSFNLSFKDLNAYYQFRLKGNTVAYVRVLSEYLLARLKMLDNIPQGRNSMELDTTKSLKYFYNLSRHSANVIRELTTKWRRYKTLEKRDFTRLESRVTLEAMSNFSLLGNIAPNPRCDEALKDLISVLTPVFLDIASKEPHPHQLYASILSLYTNITRLYYGAVNIRDRDSDMLGSNPAILEYGDSGLPLRISNDIVACLPAPTISILQNFYEPQAQVISNEAYNYVSSLENSYMRRL